MQLSIARRTRLSLVLVLALFVALFSLDAAYGQFGPPKPGPNVPNGNSPFQNNYRCSKCGATFTSSTIGGPSHCPSCGVKFINGGFDPFESPKGPVGPAAGSSKGAATAVVVVLGIGGLVLLAFLAVVALVVFLIIRATRGPAPVGVQRRSRSRYRDYDA